MNENTSASKTSRLPLLLPMRSIMFAAAFVFASAIAQKSAAKVIGNLSTIKKERKRPAKSR